MVAGLALELGCSHCRLHRGRTSGIKAGVGQFGAAHDDSENAAIAGLGSKFDRTGLTIGHG